MSTMFISFENVVPPQPGHANPGGVNADAGSVHHTPAPSTRKRAAAMRATAGSTIDCWQPSQISAGIGVPQVRCRETHHSG